MLHEPADRPPPGFRQLCAALSTQQGLTPLPQRKASVQAAPALAEQRLRHERDDLAVPGGDVADDVFADRDAIGNLDQRPGPKADRSVPGGRGRVLMSPGLNPAGRQHRHHLASEVVETIEGRQRPCPGARWQLGAEVVGLIASAPPYALA